MEHLYSSVVRVERMQAIRDESGRVRMDWAATDDPGSQWLRCRLDLQFLRPGRDVVAPMNAGVTPDRFGVMFCGPYEPLKAGDRIVTVPNEVGEMPVEGTFDIKTIPDKALDYSSAHHIEVQITETVQSSVNQFGEENDE